MIPEVKNEILSLFGRNDNLTILEIGCYDGEDTLLLHNMFPNAQIIAFEGDSRTIELFKNKVGDTEKISLVKAAVCDIDGQIEWYASINGEGHMDSSSIKKPVLHEKYHPHITFDNIGMVNSIRLDSWMQKQDIEIIDFIWADINGGEDKFIEGAKDILLNKTKYLFTEIFEYELFQGQIGLATILDILPGYRIVQKFGNNVLLKNMELAE